MNNYDTKLKSIFEIIWLSLIVITASLMAVSMMKTRELWTDEFAGILTVLPPFKDSLMQLQDYAAPLYQVILRVLVDSEYPPEWIIRGPAFICSILGLIATWWFARTLFGRRVAAITIVFIAVNPFFRSYSVEGRPYTMFLFFSVLSMVTFYKWMNRSGIKTMLPYVMSTMCLVYSH